MNPTRTKWLIAGVVLGACLAAGACADDRTAPGPVGRPTPPPRNGAINLLDASHAHFWHETRGRSGIFDIHEGVLHIPGSRGELKYVGYTGEEFGDFQLHIEFKLARGTNSGVILRSQPEAPHQTGLEVQVLDTHGRDPNKHSCGAIYDVVTPMFEVTNPAGDWNSFDITEKGQHVVVVENGWKIIDTDLSKMTMPIGKFRTPYAKLPLKGYIYLQDHHGEVWFRNIYIKNL